MIYLDACFSGQSFGGTLSRTSGLGISPTLPAAAGGFGVLTAAAADQVAVWDDETEHGVFTKHLLDALRGAANTDLFGIADGKITLAEVKAYLDINMTRAARRIGRVQHAFADANNFELVLATVPEEPPPPPPSRAYRTISRTTPSHLLSKKTRPPGPRPKCRSARGVGTLP